MEKESLSVFYNQKKKLLGLHVGTMGYHTVTLDDIEHWDLPSLQVGLLGLLRFLVSTGNLSMDSVNAIYDLLPGDSRQSEQTS